MVAETGGEICDRSSRRILETSLKTDAPKCRVAVGDAYPKTEIVTMRAPACGELCNLIAHLNRHLHGPCPRGRTRQRIVEQNHEPSPAKRSTVPSNLSIRTPRAL